MNERSEWMNGANEWVDEGGDTKLLGRWVSSPIYVRYHGDIYIRTWRQIHVRWTCPTIILYILGILVSSSGYNSWCFNLFSFNYLCILLFVVPYPLNLFPPLSSPPLAPPYSCLNPIGIPTHPSSSVHPYTLPSPSFLGLFPLLSERDRAAKLSGEKNEQTGGEKARWEFKSYR